VIVENKLLLVSRERGVLDERGGFAESVLPALSNLCASGFELILLTNEEIGHSLFSEQQFQQVLESQRISVSSSIPVGSAFNSNSVVAGTGQSEAQQYALTESENEALVAVAGRIAPYLSSASFNTGDAAIIGDWPWLNSLANYLSLRHIRPAGFAPLENQSPF